MSCFLVPHSDNQFLSLHFVFLVFLRAHGFKPIMCDSELMGLSRSRVTLCTAVVLLMLRLSQLVSNLLLLGCLALRTFLH